MATCPRCKKEYTRTSNSQKYCSVVCRDNSPELKAYRAEWQRNRTGKQAPNKLQCFICKKWYIKVCSHAYHTHGITNREYKEHVGLDLKKGVAPPHYKEMMRELVYSHPEVIKNNLVKGGKDTRFSNGHKITYTRSKQTMERLRQTSFIKKNIT